MKKNILFISIGLLLASCKTLPLQVSNVQTQKNIPINNELKELEEIKNIITPYKIKLDGAMNSKISYTEVDLTKQGNNSNLGNLLADFTYDGANEWTKKNLKINVDCAVINIGGIRANIGKGDIMIRNIFEVMPFENEIVIVKMKGYDMQGLFDYYEKNQKNNPVSKIYIETQDNKLIKSLINNQEISPTKDYYIATSDYLALGGDNMRFFAKGEIISTGLKMRDIFMDYFSKSPVIKTNSDIRLKFNGVQ